MLNKGYVRPQPNFVDKVVLITGGTRGIGLKTGLAFAQYGAKCFLTYSWGDHNEDSIFSAFEDLGATKPVLIQADVANQEDTDRLLAAVQKAHGYIDIFVSNVSVAPVIDAFENYSLKGLQRALSYSAWPMVGYSQRMHKVFGKLPHYIIAVSSTGPDHYSYGYDYVSASKAVIECMCRYLSYRFRDKAVIINAVRSRAVKTQSFESTFGKELAPFVRKFVPDNYWIEAEEVANAIVGLCSGYCDAINGQTITVDRGTSFFDNFMDMYTRYRKGHLNIEKLDQ